MFIHEAKNKRRSQEIWKLIARTIQSVLIFLKRKPRWVLPVPVKSIRWPVSQTSSINRSGKGLFETSLRYNWLNDCIIEIAWHTIPPALSSFFLPAIVGSRVKKSPQNHCSNKVHNLQLDGITVGKNLFVQIDVDWVLRYIHLSKYRMWS